MSAPNERLLLEVRENDRSSTVVSMKGRCPSGWMRMLVRLWLGRRLKPADSPSRSEKPPKK